MGNVNTKIRNGHIYPSKPIPLCSAGTLILYKCLDESYIVLGKTILYIFIYIIIIAACRFSALA